MIDTTNLIEKLNALTGLDFELAETQERAAGNNASEISFSKSFQARLAAQALNVPVADIKELPIRQYIDVCARVVLFLFGTSGEKTPSTNSENSPST